MARSDPALTVRRAESVPEESSVRHVDQLSDRARVDLELLIAGETRPVRGLEPGDIVVHTSYYRVTTAGGPGQTRSAAAADEVTFASDGGERSAEMQ